ncbi:MAG TPA: DUF4350 domain-containing protein [Terriglobales bacterium]|nr:DUF4350 domain-containing protein [Terriglobales bacterium]
MPSYLNAGDRKILLIAAGIFVLLVIGALIFVSPRDESKVPSSYSTASEGAKAAYLLLKEAGYHVDRWEQSPVSLTTSADMVLVLAEPGGFPNRKERDALKHFLDDGGKIIAIGPRAAMFLPKNSLAFEPVPDTLWQKFNALTPSRITLAAPQITLAAPIYWQQDSSVTPLYGKDEKAVVVRYAYGKGEVLWWVSATPLSNAGITEPGNLNFFLACLGDRQSVHILWDEYFHGHGQHGQSSKNHPLLAVLFAQFAVIGMAVLLSFSRRSGPLRPMPADSRSSPLEFVQTLGGLYQHARASSVAVDVYYQRFHYWLTRRLGMANDSAPEELARAVRERWNFQDDEFSAVLQSAASVRYQHDVRARDALRLVQSLHSYAARLKLFPAAKEKS